MRLAFIGPSSSGKSYWSKRLAAECHFTRFGCDEMIERALMSALPDVSFGGISSVATWMGQPYEDGYAERAALYLRHEATCISNITAEVAMLPTATRVVVDTTGSFIYLSPELQRSLTSLCTAVYLRGTPQQLIESYVKEPKPIIWGAHYEQQPNESPQQALQRSYPKLLEYRFRQYESLAQVAIDADILNQSGLTTEQFLGLIP